MSTETYRRYESCVSCGRPHHEHLETKCLFGPGQWTVRLSVEYRAAVNRYDCYGCHIITNDLAHEPLRIACPYCKALWVIDGP